MKVRTFKRTLTTFSWVAVAALVIAALTITMTVSAQTATVPDEPTGLTATAQGETRIDLSWTTPADDGGAVISGYRIEVAYGANPVFARLVGDTGSTDTTYSHANLSAGDTRFYRVFALNSVGTGSASNTAGATTAAADLLVSNTGQTGLIGDAVDIGDQDKTHSQGFDTGSNPGGYSLASVGVYVDKADLGSGEAFTVHIYTDDGAGAPDALAYTLTSPGSYTDNAVAQFTAPAGATLDKNTDYHVVFEANGNLAADFTVGATSSNGQDLGSRAGWAIENGRRFQGTKDSARTNFQISVNGSAVPTPVPPTWGLVPNGLRAGDKFRLLFLSSTKHDASASSIGAYNTFVQERAAAGHAAIREYSSGFRVIGCTAPDGRVNSRTIHTTSDKGVPIYWLRGAKAADDYEDFYDGSWDEEANDKNESGTNGPDTSQEANYPLTGCDHDGTEYRDADGYSAALGTTDVRFGRPNSSDSGHGPLSGGTSSDPSATRPFYGLSEIFQVVSSEGRLPTDGTPRTGTLDSATDEDWFAVDVVNGYYYQIDVKGSESSDPGGTLADPQVGIGTGINPAKSDTDSGRGNNALLHYRATHTGKTYVRVSAQSGGGGTYTVSVREFPRLETLYRTRSEPDWADLPSEGDTYGFVDNNGVATTGALANDDDTGDVFDMYLHQNVSYRIDVKGSESSQYGGTLTNPWIQIAAGSDELRLKNRNGSIVTQTSTTTTATGGGAGNNARLEVKPKVTGTFQAKIYREAGDNGTYTITITWLDWPQGRLAPDITVNYEHRSAVKIEWTKAKKTQRTLVAPLGSYEVDYRALPNGSWTLDDVRSHLPRTYEFTGLTPGTAYEVRVRNIPSPGADSLTYRWGYATIYTDECGSDINSPCTLSHDEDTTGRINYHADEDIDWYRVILFGNTTYTIDVKGKSTGDGTLVNPKVRLYDTNGTAVSGQQNNDGGAGKNARLTFTPGSFGNYIIAVSANTAGERGSYTVSVTAN